MAVLETHTIRFELYISVEHYTRKGAGREADALAEEIRASLPTGCKLGTSRVIQR